MFIAALFTIAKLCKQPRCPTTDEWIEKMWCICTTFYSAIKKNEMLFSGKWMELETIMLDEVSQAQEQGHMWKLDLKDECAHKCRHDLTHIHRERQREREHDCNGGLSEGTGAGRRGKEDDRVSNTETQRICV
jgi:hypothetical protein